MIIKRGKLKSFDSSEYLASICLENSTKAYLGDIAVSRNLSASEMQTDRNVVVLFWNDFSAQDAVVIAVYT